LRAGQILILPQIGDVAPVRGTSIQQPKRSLEGEWMKVTVIEGQSLWKIAAKHLGDGARYTEIMAWNDLSSEMVHPGRKLRLKEELVMGGGR
jgi:nucleoid-associated protein YgaU